MTICNEPITLLDLIDKVITPKRDFDYVVRWTYIEEFPFTEDIDTIYSRVFAISHNNGVHIVSLDGDMYSLNTKIIAYEEWTDPDNGIYNGLDIIISNIFYLVIT